ncbi:MAG: AI-2E family transporter, partial [Succinivibrio dextrinosolvens]|nr:AI-2E family transporter [Succinivibrio dextrinosolvens]
VNAMTWLMYMIIVPIFTFLMLANKETLQKRFKDYILPTNQDIIGQFWKRINGQLEAYIRGKVLHIIIITIVNTLAFMLLGVNYAFLLGFGVGLSVIIPYVGAALITIPVVLIPVFQFGFCTYVIWILVVYLIIQLLDGNVLTPFLFSKAMNLDAFSILSAILIFGGLWGFWGVFFSIPLATFIGSMVKYWPIKDKEGAEKDNSNEDKAEDVAKQEAISSSKD